jgi:signal transduction histidine kinase
MDTGLPGLEARFDPEQLTQMPMNLLLNAIEAAGQNGTIAVRLEQRWATARIEVHDGGPS